MLKPSEFSSGIDSVICLPSAMTSVLDSIKEIISKSFCYTNLQLLEFHASDQNARVSSVVHLYLGA